MTITAAELERRLAARGRQRQGRRVTWLAAAVAAIAIGSIVAGANGWIDRPAAVVGATSSPDPTSPVVVTPVPSGSAAPTAVPSPSAPIARVPFGRADDTILVSERSTAAGSELVVTVVHEDMTSATGPILSEASFPHGTTIDFDHPPRLSVTGYLLVSLSAADDSSAGAALYDLLDPGAEPRFFTDPSIVAFAWSPTGLLATDDTATIVISDPADPATTPKVVPIGENVSLTTMGPSHGIAWTADGQGFVADGNVSGAFVPGILGLDGTFSADPTVVPFASVGTERPTNLTGQFIESRCAESGATGDGLCRLVATDRQGVQGQVWSSDGQPLPADHIWSADAQRLWILSIDDRAGARTIRVQLGGPGTYVEVAKATGLPVPADSGTAVFAGLTADDSRIAIDLGTGQTLLVDRITGDTVTFDGTFVGWGDPTGFIYPNPEAP